MACGPLLHLLCIWLAIAGLSHFLFRNPGTSQWWVAYDLDKYDSHVLTLSYLFWTHPQLHFQRFSRGETWHLTCIYWGSCLCTWAHFLFKNQWSCKPRKFSSELELACPSTKLYHLERFAIYGSWICHCHW